MDIVVHRVNTRAQLDQVPSRYGAEIDIRADGGALVLHHEPGAGGERLDDFLAAYHHGTLVLNVKEAGIEADVLARVRAAGVASYFLLDVEFPYLYRASRAGERAIAVRYSEEEPLALVERYRGAVDWVWIDTFTTLPLDAVAVRTLAAMKSCLVCPERWGRPQDILPYRRRLRALAFEPTAVMTALAHAPDWERALPETT